METDLTAYSRRESIEGTTEAKNVAMNIKAVFDLVDYVKDKDRLGNERIYWENSKSSTQESISRILI